MLLRDHKWTDRIAISISRVRMLTRDKNCVEWKRRWRLYDSGTKFCQCLWYERVRIMGVACATFVWCLHWIIPEICVRVNDLIRRLWTTTCAQSFLRSFVVNYLRRSATCWTADRGWITVSSVDGCVSATYVVTAFHTHIQWDHDRLGKRAVLLSASLYVSKRGAYWDRLCRDVVGWLVVGCHARALWPNGAS